MTKKNKINRRVSKSEHLCLTTVQDNAHLSTQDIVRKRSILTLEAAVADSEIVELNAKLTDARARRGRIDAVLNGLAIVVGAR